MKTRGIEVFKEQFYDNSQFLILWDALYKTAPHIIDYYRWGYGYDFNQLFTESELNEIKNLINEKLRLNFYDKNEIIILNKFLKFLNSNYYLKI